MKRNFTSLTSKNIHLLLWVGFFLLTIGHLSAQCLTMPEPVSYTQVSKTTKRVEEYATINGITVTRILETRGWSIDKIRYSNEETLMSNDHDSSKDTRGDEYYCGKWRMATFGNKKYPFMDSNKVSKITYKFSKPVMDAEVFLAAFGYSGTKKSWDNSKLHQDRVIITTNSGGTTNLDLRSSCTSGAATIESGNKVVSERDKTTDVKVGVTSTEPFTELYLQVEEKSGQTGGYGFFVEICLETLELDNSVCSAETPSSITDPFGGSSAATKVATVNGVQVTRKMTAGKLGSLGSDSYCGSTKNYPPNLPLLGGAGGNKLIYEFDKPVNNIEILLYAFGDKFLSGTYDEIEFEVDGGGTLSLQKVFECNVGVSNITGRTIKSATGKILTDVSLKLVSTQPFTKITLTDKGSTGKGSVVALCPSSVQALLETSYNCTPATIGSNFARQQVATAQMNNITVTRRVASVNDISTGANTSNHCGGNVTYPAHLPLLIGNKQITYDFSTPIRSAEIFLYYFGDNINGGTFDKVRFAVNSGTASLAKVYDCYPGAAVINGLEVTSTSKKLTTDVGIRVTSTAPFTRITLTDVNSNGGGYYVVICPTSIKRPPYNSGAQCGPNMPDPMFVGTTTATANGIQVNINRPAGTERTTNYSTASVTTCQTVYKAGTTFLQSNKSVTYKFSQPVNNVEVWLALMGGHKEIPSNRDAAKITTNCGTNPTLTLVSDCVGNAAIDNNVVWADGEKGVDVGVKVTSDKPFMELTITDFNSTAAGYFVDLCPVSIKKQGTGNTDAVTITTQLTATTTACVGFTTTLTTQATLASPFSGSLNYQWQKSTNNGTTWSDISGQSGSAASGANVTYSFTPTTSDNNALYRVAYTYTHAGSFCGTLSLTTNATKLVANTVSSVIAINAPAYTDVAVCASATGTTTITAKATLNTGMGGTGVTYQLQYRPTDTANWVDHATQKYTLVTGGAEKILTIANVASNTGYYRVKYTSDASVCGGGESYSNIFKFTALTVTDVLTINPTTYPNKVVCTDATFTINAQATVATGTIVNIGGNRFSYELQYKANSSANWVNYALPNGGATQTYSNNTKVGATRVFTINTANVANGGKFRVRYAVDLVGLCDDISAYSNEFTVTKASVLNNITEFYATPATLNETGATNVVYTIKGVPGTQLLHKFNNGTATAASIPPGGVLTITHNGQTATATLAITQVANGTCTLTTNYLVEVGKAGGACTSFPSPQFAKTATAAAQIGGLTVNRTITGTPQFFDAYTYDSGQMCQSTILAGYPIMKGGQATIKYTFSKPVTSVQVWLSGFGGNPSVANADSVTFAVNCGGTEAVNAVGCGTDAGKLTVAGGKVSHQANVYTQAKVVVTSDKPFTELTLTDPDNSSAGGYVVELCPISVVSVGTMSVTAQPTPKTICAGDDSKLEAKAILTGVPASYSISYEWQQSDDATTWIKAVAPVAPAPTGSVLNNGIHTSTLTLKNVPVSYNGKYFRVVFKYTSCTTTVVTATSTTVRLTVTTAATPTVSSTTTLCPTANSNIVSFDNYVTPAVGTTLRWYATPTATASTTVAPTINTNVTTRTTATAYVRAINNNGCTSGLVTVTLTVNDTTPPTFNAPSALNIVCNSTTATTAINTWLGTATATDACGAIATITNNYNAPADFCTVPGGVITVTFVAKDTFGNVTTKTSTIKLAATPLTVASDTFTVGNGVTTQTAGNILTNDNLGGNTPTAGPTGSVTITVVTPATPIGGGKTPTLDVNTGIVTVPAGTKSGTYTITYKECESLNPSSNCQTQTVVISVGSASLTVVPETLTVTPSTSTQTTPSIFDNDSIGGVTTPTAGPGGNVTMTVHNPSGSKVPTMDPNTGKVTVPGNIPAGNYTITYNYCEVLNPTNCTGTRTVVVTVGAATLTVASDTFTVGNGVTTQTAGNILTNDNLGGNTPTAGPTGSVTITVVTPATPIGGGKTPTLDVNTGIVTVPAGTKSGTYTITYKECESLNPSSNCQTQTVVISVGSASLTVVPETLTVTPSTSTQTTPSIFDNDSIGGVTTPTAGPGGNVTMTVHNPSGSKVPTMDPNTGKVTVPGNTPAGNYTITYNYCEVLNPTNCTGTRTVVVTVGAPELVVPSKVYPLAPGTTSTETVIDTATLGGNPVSSTAVTIAVVTPATSLGGTPTPTLNTTTGKITVPTGTKSGTYNIVYRVCEVLNPSNCKTATATVVVGEVPVITPDNLPIVPSTPTSTTTRTIGNILTNDTVGTQSATAGTGGNVTITITSPITPNTPVIDPTTGNVQIPPTTPPGVYTITYDVCTTATPVACTSGTLTVTISQPSPIIRPENLTVTQTGTSTTPSILNNDDIVKPDGTTASATGSNVTITNVVVTPGAAPGAPTPTLNPDGTITVPGTLPPGVYTITYDVCTTATPSTCVSGTTVLTVSPTATATPTAGDNTYDVPTSGTATVVGTILSNDTVDGVASATATNVTVSVTTVPTGTGVPTIGSNGSVTVPANAIPGVYTYTYHICSVATPTACSTEATVTVTVRQPVPVLPNNNMVYTDTTTTTAGNITTGGTVGTQSVTTGPTGNVTITVVTPATPQVPGGTVPTLNPDGTVTVPTGTASGTYTITYQVCTTATPTSCVTGVVTITVSPTATATPTAGDNTYDVPTSGTATVVGTILSNDTVDGVASATATNVTVSVTTVPTGTGVPTIGSNGSVTVPANAIPGVYTYTYHICSVATPTACSTEATVTVTVRQPVPVLPNNNMVYTDTTTTTAGNITTGGTVGTQSVTTGPTGNVTITVVTPATPQVPGGTVPTLNPDGTVTVPTGTASGTYTITYQVCTTATPTSCVTGVVTITVSPTTVTPTVLPVAVDDRASTAVNTPVNIAVLPNDTLNGATTPNVVTSPANGTVMVNSDNTIEYRPHTGFTGTDTFVYEICNSAGCSSATVTVEVVNKIIPYSGMSVNGDGKNDHFHIGGIENYPNNVVRIYNRWGVKVFEVNGYDNVTRVFRGISDARATVEAADKLPQGTYYYVIEYYDQNNKKQSEVGWLYLKK